MLAPLYTSEEMKAAEAGHDVSTLMESAGQAVAEAAMRRFPRARTFALYAGKGANGGDGKIAARIREERGWKQVGEGADVVIDALLGTGIRGAPRDDVAAEIQKVNDSGAPVLAVDIPSGVDASTGEVEGAAVRATITVTMHGHKVGLAVGPGCFRSGDVVTADLGLEHGETRHRLVTHDILRVVPRKGGEDNKYTAGSVLVVGGARGTTGAAALAARAAFRADAGYVAIAVEAAHRASALALGPGLGRDQQPLVRRLLQETELPAVVDADALYELKPFDRAAPTVLTPHSGELARLLGEESKWVDAHRLEALARAVDRFQCIVLLKGADTLIGAPGDGVWVVGDNVPSLATAGTGDVLTGIIAAFLAKRMDAREAVAAAAVAHRLAAARGPRRGLGAGDVIDALPGCNDQS